LLVGHQKAPDKSIVIKNRIYLAIWKGAKPVEQVSEIGQYIHTGRECNILQDNH